MWLEIRLETQLGPRTFNQGYAKELAFIWRVVEGLQAMVWLNALKNKNKNRIVDGFGEEKKLR